jgi:hypothetical protein
MKCTEPKTWLPRLILGFSLYALASSTSFAQAIVNCPGDSIQDAVDAAPAGGVYSILINGVCTENVVINRDNVQLFGGTGGGVTGASTLDAIRILGASGVLIQDLTVSNGGGSGIVLLANAGANISNVTIADNAGTGLFVRQGSFASVANGTTISGSGFCEVQVSEAGNVWMQDTTIVSNQPDVNVCVGLGIYRDASVRMLGTNSITNTTPTGFAIDVFHGSTLRQSNGHTTVSGHVEVGNESNMDFRDADITGNATAFYNSVLRMRNSSFTGDFFVNETNVLQFSSAGGSTTINGTIHCNGGTLFGSSNVTATAIDCPAPIHVLRADGTAKIRAEELNAAVAARSMFELVNNGPIGFNMTNTDAGLNWRFAAQTTGFRVSLDGTGGPELEVGNGGTLQVGPGGAANLTLDASGNLTVAGTVNGVSDRNAKTAIVALNGAEVLTKLTALPVSQWAYKKEPAVNHIGPMAQDFYGAFGLGADDTHLAPGDLAGVAVIGVKALHKMIEVREATIATHEAKLVEQESKIAEQAAKLAERATEIVELKQRLVALEGMVSRIVAKQTTRTAQR